ncbi:MAG: ABC transporter permease [Planctomycetota bacterium]|nr:ABC transporter permease [Planctomycetota bacterium]
MKYLRLLRLFLSTSIQAEMEYRLNFVIAALSSIGGLAGSLFGLSLFYRGNDVLGGWVWDEALVVLGFFTLLQGVSASFLSANLSKIVGYVQMGTLDFVLLKPVDSQFWLSTRAFSLWGIPDLLLGTFIIGLAGTRLGLGPLDYLSALFPLLCGLVTLYSLWFMLGATSIWFVKVYNVTEVLRKTLEAGRFPITAFPAAWRIFFTYVVPVAFMTSVPAETLLGRGSAPWLLGAIVLAATLSVIARSFWHFALRFYTSASS